MCKQNLTSNIHHKIINTILQQKTLQFVTADSISKFSFLESSHVINNTKAIEDISEEDKKFKEGNVKYDENIGKANNVRWARPRWSTSPWAVADFPAVFFHISLWFLS